MDVNDKTIMIEPDDKTLRSLMYINSVDQAKPFMDWLRASLQQGYESTGQLNMPETIFRQVQGGNACLDTIIKKIETAYDTHRSLIVNKTLDEAAGKAL